MKAKDIEAGRTIILNGDDTAYVVHVNDSDGQVELTCLRNGQPFMVWAAPGEDIPVPRGRPLKADA